jgi:hypothetical protein
LPSTVDRQRCLVVLADALQARPMSAMSQGKLNSQYDFIVCGSTGTESIDQVGAECIARIQGGARTK